MKIFISRGYFIQTMVDVEKLHGQLKKANAGIKTLRIIQTISVLGIGFFDKLTDGKASALLNEVQQKIDTSFGPALEQKIQDLDAMLEAKVGKRVEAFADKIEQKIDSSGGGKLDQILQTTAEKVESVYKSSEISKKVDTVKAKVQEKADVLKNTALKKGKNLKEKIGEELKKRAKTEEN